GGGGGGLDVWWLATGAWGGGGPPTRGPAVAGVVETAPVARARWLNSDRKRSIRARLNGSVRGMLVRLDPQTHPLMFVRHGRPPMTRMVRLLQCRNGFRYIDD